MTQVAKLKAPFPYFGGKSRVAKVVWERFGAVDAYIEPFCGSAAIMLANPHPPRAETVNDADGFIVNFWRAVQRDPDAVASWCDWPVTEIDLHARHGWLLNRAERLRWSLEDPDFYDAKIAGWWVWGQSASIGYWCSGEGPWVSDGAQIVKMPSASDAGARGFWRQKPSALHVGKSYLGRGVLRPGLDVSAELRSISDRLRRVQVLCGDWSRVLGRPHLSTAPSSGPTVTAIFMDPPYAESVMDYAAGGVGTSLSRDVAKWCAEHGGDARLRIALCGHAGEHDLEEAGWSSYAWKRSGMARRKETLARESQECIWFSPHCLPADAQLGLEVGR